MKTPKPMPTTLPFNAWSTARIIAGRKSCTSRNERYDDPCVYLVLQLPLGVVRDYLWKEEGADSPEEFEKVWRGLHRGRFDPEKMVYVHFGHFAGVCDPEVLDWARKMKDDFSRRFAYAKAELILSGLFEP